MDIRKFIDFKDKVIGNVSKIIVGKDDVIELMLISFICGGHVLLEDIPGVGKTMMARAFAKTVGSGFTRIQFTPDLLPSDLTGINFYNQKTGEFEFKPGPLFTNLLLADEINRATPRTQSSLLEAMEERQITVDGVTRRLDMPYMVLATQNPIETYGTFPLPEAQLDRFFMRISVGYPKRDEEIEIISRKSQRRSVEQLECVVTPQEIDYVQSHCQDVIASDDVMGYLMDIVEATRQNDNIRLGVSPRGAIALFHASQACAALEGREYLIPEDIKKMAPFVLNHRMALRGQSKGRSALEFTAALVDGVAVPVEEM